MPKADRDDPRRGKDYAFVRARLVAARRAAGLSRAEVARRLGRTAAEVAALERGARRADVVETLELAALYGKPLAWFLPRRARRRRRP